MRCRLLVLVVLVVGVALCGDVQQASATKIFSLPWQQLALQADFVGVVECDIAGGNVAEYRVVEVWHGPQKVGDHIRIEEPPDYWAGQYHLTLCGSHYYVTGFKSTPPDTLVSTTAGGPIPVWWRNIPVDYEIPLVQGRKLLSTEKDKGEWLDTRRKEAQALFALKPAQQEAELLRIMIKHDLLRGNNEKDKAFQALQTLVENKAGTEELLNELIRLAPSINSPLVPERLPDFLAEAGGPVTLALLEKMPRRSIPWRNHDALLRQLRVRLGKEKPEVAAKPEAEARPTDTAMRAYRNSLAVGPNADDFLRAFDQLSKYDPAAVVDFLNTWKPTEGHFHDGYILGSIFGVRCGKDREKHFRALRAAKSPYIRVAAAVYLCYENEQEGVAALEKLTALEGDPGAWAALTLARRGNKDVVPRLLEVFGPVKERTEHDPDSFQETHAAGRERRQHELFQLRALELFSNAAKSAEVPQPPFSLRKNGLENITEWWKQHGEKIKLHDPWLEILAKQKVD